MDIQPIETTYRGYRFRSRLEARWAVFFDALGVKWEYEPEGFDLPGGERYLPDFYLPDVGIYVEIKPREFHNRMPTFHRPLTDPDWKRIYEFSGFHTTVVLMGPPGDYSSYGCEGIDGGTTVADMGIWYECAQCGAIGFGFVCASEAEGYGKCNCNCDATWRYETPRILRATEAARSARFEYGETPAHRR